MARPPKINPADKVIDAWINDAVKQYSIAETYYSEVREIAITDEECKELAAYGISEPQCDLLQRLLPVDKFIVTDSITEDLKKGGFQDKFVKDLSGSNGFKPLYARASMFVESIVGFMKGCKGAGNKDDCSDRYEQTINCMPYLGRLKVAREPGVQLNPHEKVTPKVYKDVKYDYYRWRCDDIATEDFFTSWQVSEPSRNLINLIWIRQESTIYYSLWRDAKRPLFYNMTDAARILLSAFKDKKMPVHFRCYLLEIAGTIDTTGETVRTLVDALEDRDPKIRASAAIALGHMARRLRLIMMSKDVNVNMRSGAEDALIRMEPIVSLALTSAYSSDDPPFVRFAFVKALSKLASNNTMNGLLKILDDQRELDQMEAEIREVAVHALGAMGADASIAIPKLSTIIRTGKGKFLCLAAVKALGSIGLPEGIPVLEEILARVDEKGQLAYPGYVRYAAVLALGKITGGNSLSILMNVATIESNIEVQVAAINAIAERGKDATSLARPLLAIAKKAEDLAEDRVGSLRRSLKEKNPFKQCYDGYADDYEDGDTNVTDCYYKKIEAARVKSDVFKELVDNDRKLAAVAIRALGKIGSKEVVSELVDFLDSDVKLVRMVAANALGDYGPNAGAEAKDELVEILEDDDEDTAMREAAAAALGRMK